jgi:hypothetical protein
MPRLSVDQQSVELDATALSMLLDGIDYERVKRQNHWRPKNRSKVDRQTTRDLINRYDGTIA